MRELIEFIVTAVMLIIFGIMMYDLGYINATAEGKAKCVDTFLQLQERQQKIRSNEKDLQLKDVNILMKQTQVLQMMGGKND